MLSKQHFGRWASPSDAGSRHASGWLSAGLKAAALNTCDEFSCSHTGAFLLDHLVYYVNCLLRYPVVWSLRCFVKNTPEFIAPISRRTQRLLSVVIQRAAYIPLVRGSRSCCGITFWHWCRRKFFHKTWKIRCVLSEIQWTNQEKGNLPDRPEVWKSFQGFVSAEGSCVVPCEDSCRTLTLEIPAD